MRLQLQPRSEVGGRAKRSPRLGRGAGLRSHEPVLVYLRTEGADHEHVAVFNDAGDGITTEVRGHTHRICGLEIEPGEDGHTHELGERRVPPIEYARYRTMLCRRPV